MASILYIAQFFSTDSEPGGQGQRHYKHAKALASDGHSVTVITSGLTTMSSQEQTAAVSEEPDVQLEPNLRIIRIPSPPMAKRCVVSRALRYFDFSFKALLAGLRLVFQEKQVFNFVMGSSPPLLIGLVAYVISLFARADFYFEIRDLWSQTMAANGFIKNRLAIELNRWLESHLYRESKKIIIVSEAYRSEIEAQVKGSKKKIVFIPNGADMEFYDYPKLWKGSYLHNKPEEDHLFHVVYAGVFSDYTRLETLLTAADLLKESHPDIRIHLAGGGYQVLKLRQMAEGMNLPNVNFWGTLPKNRITKFIMEGDLSVINYRNLGIYGQVIPNKLFDYLASGRPILAAAPEGEISRILEDSGAGKTIAPEDPQALADAIVWFYENQQEGQKMGFQGQKYVKRHFNRELLVEQLLALFPRVIPMAPSKRREAAANQSAQSNVVQFRGRKVGS